MTITSTLTSSGPYTGNGATTAFAFTFDAATGDVAVLVDGSVISPSTYTVTLNAGGNGGTVTFDTAPDSGAEIIPYLDPSFTQNISFTNAGAFLPESHDEANDRAARRDIYLKGEVERSFRVPVGKSGLLLDGTVGVLGVDADGNAVLHAEGEFIGPQGPGTDGAQVPVAVGDAATDDNTAFQLVTTEDQGHTVRVPADKYRLSATQVFKGLVNYRGEGIGESPGIVDGVTYNYPTAFNGSVLYFDAGVRGLEFQPHTSVDDYLTVSADVAAHYTQFSSHGSVLSHIGIFSASNGTPGTGDGIYAKARINLLHGRTYGFPGDGVNLAGSTDGAGGDGVPWGNVNTSLFVGWHSDNNGGDGWHIRGRNGNAMTFVGCSASNNDGWGINDEGLLGNTYVGFHLDANVGGPARVSGSVAATCFFGTHCEPTGPLSDLGPSTMVIGGSFANDAPHPIDSPAFILTNGGSAIRKGISGLNNLGATEVTAGLGRDPSLTDNCAFWFGSLDDNPTQDTYRLVKNAQWTGIWTLTYANSAQVLEYITGDHAASALTNGYALGLPNGSYMGTAQSAPRLLPAAAAAPVAGTYRAGDVVHNNAPTAGGFVGWVCVTAGTPGTWKTFGAISA